MIPTLQMLLKQNNHKRFGYVKEPYSDYSSDDLKPVIDHCHATGKILGLAHSICNSKRINNQFVPIYFHNLSKYDAHFIVDGLKYFGKAGQNRHHSQN